MSFSFIYIQDIFVKKYTKSIYYSPKQVSVMVERECKYYVKICFKKAELIHKRFYHIVFLEICKLLNLMPKGLAAKKWYCVGGTSENFEKKWDANLQEMKIKCQDLVLKGTL